MHKVQLFEGNFGLERETLRVDREGRLAQTPHPFTSEYLARDFCENQLEIVTPVCHSIESMLTELQRLDAQARKILLQQDETLWLYSNPPAIDSEDEIPVARFEGALSEKSNYRKNLERRYGKRLMLYSGIHFNFSFSEEFLQQLYTEHTTETSLAAFKNDTYLRLLKQASRYSYLLVLLTAASPVYDKSFDSDGSYGKAFDGYASMRSGKRGYWNQFVPVLDYSSLTAYADSIQRYVDKGILFSAGELYLPVRIKPQGENSLRSLRKNGADHIELRMFDLNPLEVLGINKTDLEFAYLLLVYLTSLEDFDFTPEMQQAVIEKHQKAAKFLPEEEIMTEAAQILKRMSEFFQGSKRAEDVIRYEREKISGRRICEKVTELLERTGSDSDVRAFGNFLQQNGECTGLSAGFLCPQSTASSRMGADA